MTYHVALSRTTKRYAVIPSDAITDWRDVFFTAYGREYVHCAEFSADAYGDACVDAARRNWDHAEV